MQNSRPPQDWIDRMRACFLAERMDTMNENQKIRAVIWGLDGVLVPETTSSQAAGEPRLDRRLVEFIRAMRGELRTALLVSSWAEVWQAVANRAEIEATFDQVILPPETGERRPEERLVSHAAGELGLRPAEAVFVGNSSERVSAARSTGMHAVHFKNAAQAGSDLLSLLMEPLAA